MKMVKAIVKIYNGCVEEVTILGEKIPFEVEEIQSDKPKEVKEEREYIQINQEDMATLKEILEIKGNECYYCGEYVAPDKLSIFNKPTRLVCNSPLCITSAMTEDEAEKEKKEKGGVN